MANFPFVSENKAADGALRRAPECRYLDHSDNLGRRCDVLVGMRITAALRDVLCGPPGDDLGNRVAAAARRYASDQPAGWQRMRVRQGLHLRLTSYLANHLPHQSWHLVGAEVSFEPWIVDLVWESPVGVFFDELKGHIPSSGPSAKVATQVDRYLAAGHVAYGERFLGLRLISLSDATCVIAFPPQFDLRVVGA